MTGTLSALGSVSASRSVRSGRFGCITYFEYMHAHAIQWRKMMLERGAENGYLLSMVGIPFCNLGGSRGHAPPGDFRLVYQF